MPQADSNPPSTRQQLQIDFSCGLITGAFCSGLFNPWDRALYLSVKNHTPFLTRENFKSPYHGFTQSVVQRTYTGSIYYFMQSELNHQLYPLLKTRYHFNETASQFCIGTLAGAITALSSNSIAAVKYHTWGKENRTFLLSVSRMWNDGGYRPFLRGTRSTLARDVAFGSTYEVLRHTMHDRYACGDNYYFVFNTLSALLATVASAPFNYARTMQYATPPSQTAPSILQALVDVAQQSKTHDGLNKLSFFQQRFRIGWGTGRVAFGMGVGQAIFDCCQSRMTQIYSDERIWPKA